jgi:hypothetical protein
VSVRDLRDAALAAGIVLHQLHACHRQIVARAIAQAPRPVLIAAGMATVTAIAAVMHLTGYVPTVGATTGLPRGSVPPGPASE